MGYSARTFFFEVFWKPLSLYMTAKKEKKDRKKINRISQNSSRKVMFILSLALPSTAYTHPHSRVQSSTSQDEEEACCISITTQKTQEVMEEANPSPCDRCLETRRYKWLPASIFLFYWMKELHKQRLYRRKRRSEE